MDDDVGVGAGPAERARHAGGGGPAPACRRRMSAGRERDAALGLPRGGDPEPVSRGLGVTAAELGGRRERFLAAGEASPGSRPADARDAGIGRLEGKVGDLTTAAELLEAGIGRPETARPSARRRSRRRAAGSRPPRRCTGSGGSRACGACRGRPSTATGTDRAEPPARDPGRSARCRTMAWSRRSGSS